MTRGTQRCDLPSSNGQNPSSKQSKRRESACAMACSSGDSVLFDSHGRLVLWSSQRFSLCRAHARFTPARLALERPIAMACLVERAPCFPSRTWCISSRTNSPACELGDLPPSRLPALSRWSLSRASTLTPVSSVRRTRILRNRLHAVVVRGLRCTGEDRQLCARLTGCSRREPVLRWSWP